MNIETAIANAINNAEGTIDWDKALNPEHYLEEYYKAAVCIVEPENSKVPEEEYDFYCSIMDNDNIAWLNVIKHATDDDRWIRMAELVTEFGY